MSSHLSASLQSELQDLVDTMLDNKLTPNQRERLNQILQDERAAEFYVHYFHLHSELAWQFRRDSLPSEFQPDQGTPPHFVEPQDQTTQRQVGSATARSAKVDSPESTLKRTAAAFSFALTLLLIIGAGQIVSDRYRRIDRKKNRSQTSEENTWQLSAKSLQGLTLTEIGDKPQLRVMFQESSLAIINQAGPIPAPLVEIILGEESDASKIVATWKLNRDATQLLLTDLVVDGEASDISAHLTLTAAGLNRIELGGVQYATYPNGYLDSPNKMNHLAPGKNQK